MSRHLKMTGKRKGEIVPRTLGVIWPVFRFIGRIALAKLDSFSVSPVQQSDTMIVYIVLTSYVLLHTSPVQHGKSSIRIRCVSMQLLDW